jgi:hypothetical protein
MGTGRNLSSGRPTAGQACPREGCEGGGGPVWTLEKKQQLHPKPVEWSGNSALCRTMTASRCSVRKTFLCRTGRPSIPVRPSLSAIAPSLRAGALDRQPARWTVAKKRVRRGPGTFWEARWFAAARPAVQTASPTKFLSSVRDRPSKFAGGTILRMNPTRRTLGIV